VHGGFFGGGDPGGAQAEAFRIPQADGTLYPLPVGEDDALMPSLLTLSDVTGTVSALDHCERSARSWAMTAICAHHAARIDVNHTFRTAEAGGLCRRRALCTMDCRRTSSRESRSGGAAHALDIACARISS
jgi:hypothetical protein